MFDRAPTTSADATAVDASSDAAAATTAASIRRPGLFSALAVAGALALAGCGSDAEEDNAAADDLQEQLSIDGIDGDSGISRQSALEFIRETAVPGTIRFITSSELKGGDFPREFAPVVIFCTDDGDQVLATVGKHDGSSGTGGSWAVDEAGCYEDGTMERLTEGQP